MKAFTRNFTYLKCEDCRKHGRCNRERTAFKWWHVKGCMVELKNEKTKDNESDSGNRGDLCHED